MKAERAVSLEFFLERITFEPFHRDVGDAFSGPSGVNDIDDVLMLEPPDNPGFALEKLDQLRRADGQIGQKYLDSYLTPGIQVNGAVNSPHPAHSDERIEAILVHKRAANEVVRVL